MKLDTSKLHFFDKTIRANISPTMSIGNKIPMDSFAGKININTVTTKIPELGNPDLENPIKTAHIITMIQ